MYQSKIGLVIALIVVIAIVPFAFGSSGSASDHPSSCDGMPVSHHLKRAKALIDTGYSKSRFFDKTPLKRSEKASLKKHKFCIQIDSVRDHIAELRDQAADAYQRKLDRAKRKALYTKLIGEPSNPGSAWLASTRWCESGSSGSYNEDPDAGYSGAYQFAPEAWNETLSAYKHSGYAKYSPPASMAYLASPDQQDIRAAILFRAHGSAPWPNCG